MSRFGWSSLAMLAMLAPMAWAEAPPRSAEEEDGLAFLQKFEGDWDVQRIFFPPSGEPIRGEGRCRQTLILGGRFLQSDFQFGTGPTATTGLGLMGFDPQTGRFTSVWADSRSPHFLFRQSREPLKDGQVSLFSQPLDPESSPQGAHQQSRALARLEDGGQRIIHQQYTVDADGNEHLVLELRMERRADSKAPEN